MPQQFADAHILRTHLVNNLANPKASATLKNFCELVAHYPEWKLWRTHPLCFLTLEEITVAELYVRLGTVRQVVEQVQSSVPYISTMLHRITARLEVGQVDYADVMTHIRNGKRFPVGEIPELILRRPYELHGLSARLTNALKQSGFPNLLAMEQDTSLITVVTQLRGIGDTQRQELHKLLEKYDLHYLLINPQTPQRKAEQLVDAAARSTVKE